MDFEVINEKAGGCGIYHYIVFFLLAMTTFKQAVVFQGLTFALYEPKFECVPDVESAKVNISYDKCSYTIGNGSSLKMCRKWIFEKTVFKSSLITELNLVCSKAHYKDLIYTIFFLGRLAGYPMSVLSDKIGRRYILMSFLYLSGALTLLQTYFYNIWALLAIAFFSEALTSVAIGLAFTTLVELMPIERLDIAASHFWIFYSIGYMSTAAFAYLCRTWRMIYALSLIPAVLYLLYFCFVPDTPRWLMLKGRKEESFKTMSFIARVNGRTLLRNDFDKWHPTEDETGKVWTLCKHRIMVGRILILTFASWSFSLAYMAISTDLHFASNNIFLTTLVMGMVEIPTGPLAAVMMRLMKRKRSITCLCSFGIACLLTMPFVEADPSRSSWQPWLKAILAMGGKLGFTSAWSVFDVVTSELIPTTVRNGGLAFISMTVTIGSMVAPKVHSIATGWHFLAPNMIYSIFLIATVMLVVLFLPETKHLPLPQTLEQAVSLQMGKEQQWKASMAEDANLGNVNDDAEIDSKCL